MCFSFDLNNKVLAGEFKPNSAAQFLNGYERATHTTGAKPYIGKKPTTQQLGMTCCMPAMLVCSISSATTSIYIYDNMSFAFHIIVLFAAELQQQNKTFESKPCSGDGPVIFLICGVQIPYFNCYRPHHTCVRMLLKIWPCQFHEQK